MLWQVSQLITELAAAGQAALGVDLDEGTVPRLQAYARSVAHFPTAVKEVCVDVIVCISLPMCVVSGVVFVACLLVLHV